MNAQHINTTGRPGETVDPRSEPAPVVLQVIAILLVLGVMAYVGFGLVVMYALKDWHLAF
jgi:hypothetical protein